MAYAALVSLSQTIHKLLQDKDRFPISPYEKQHIISLHERIIFLQAFLENFPTKGNSLEGRIRDVANEAEDIIEYFMWKQIDQRRNSALKSNLEPGSSEVSHLTGMCFGSKNLKEVTEKIESVAREVMDIMNSTRSTDDDSCVATASSFSSSSRLIIAPPTSKDPIVGFEDDLLEIKGRLCGESYQLQVIPIFGMGGIGKTTLAKNAYDDQLIVEHFQIRAWVTVSQGYSVRQILSNLLVSVGIKRYEGMAKLEMVGKIRRYEEMVESEMVEKRKHYEEMDESEMAEHVYRSLKGRRYLIVMDDMWCTKAWDDVRRIFSDDNNGSRILLTTRLLDVATYPSSSSPIHRMRFMDAEQSWNLLRKKVFGRGNCPCELEVIGKIIARSCRGLPLAIIVIAGLLSTRSQIPAFWEYIARNVSDIVTANDEQFADIVLSLSYNHLPHRLRSCFLYFGIFPEDYEIRVSDLIKLWVAEGFLKLPNGSKSFEEVAEEYLEDLVKRSLVFVMKGKSNGKIKSCNVHDLVRDLCIRKAQQEKFLLHVASEKLSKDVQESLRNQRRISFAAFHPSFLDKICDPASTSRSVIHFSGRRETTDKLFLSSLKSMRLLRVFQIASCKAARWWEPFPWVSSISNDAVLESFHLRCLSIKTMTRIPAAISKLKNLQTLIIDPRDLWELSQKTVGSFPPEIWRMSQLRHLVSFSYYCLPDPAERDTTFALENLQTLSVANFVFSNRIVEMVPNLKKLVTACRREIYGQEDDYHLENLVHLQHLEKLKLYAYGPWGYVSTYAKRNPIFPRTLKKITLVHCKGLTWEDIGIVIGSLPNLEVFKLKYFSSNHGDDKWETREGQFLSLKFLLIEGGCLCHWITESSHFPRLESLVLRRCRLLNEIPDGIGEISTLELIDIYRGNQSLLDSARRIQEEQQSWGNDALQVRLR